MAWRGVQDGQSLVHSSRRLLRSAICVQQEIYRDIIRPYARLKHIGLQQTFGVFNRVRSHRIRIIILVSFLQWKRWRRRPVRLAYPVSRDVYPSTWTCMDSKLSLCSCNDDDCCCCCFWLWRFTASANNRSVRTNLPGRPEDQNRSIDQRVRRHVLVQFQTGHLIGHALSVDTYCVMRRLRIQILICAAGVRSLGCLTSYMSIIQRLIWLCWWMLRHVVWWWTRALLLLICVWYFDVTLLWVVIIPPANVIAATTCVWFVCLFVGYSNLFSISERKRQEEVV